MVKQLGAGPQAHILCMEQNTDVYRRFVHVIGVSLSESLH